MPKVRKSQITELEETKILERKILKEKDSQSKTLETSSLKPPKVIIPRVKTAGVKTPRAKTAGVKTPRVKTVGVKTPKAKTAGVKTPRVKTVGGKTSQAKVTKRTQTGKISKDRTKPLSALKETFDPLEASFLASPLQKTRTPRGSKTSLRASPKALTTASPKALKPAPKRTPLTAKAGSPRAVPKVGAKVLRAPRALKEELSYPAPKKLLGSKGPLRESSKGRAFKKVPLQSRELAALVSKAASEHKISSPVLINLAGVSQITDFYYIVSAENSRQVRSVAEKIVLRVKEAGLKTLSVEGLAISDTRWVLIDLGDVIVHVFLSEARELYDLEGLFADAPRLDPKSLAPLAGSAKV